jgi:GNAT superfamily N-acetyltransferase
MQSLDQTHTVAREAPPDWAQRHRALSGKWSSMTYVPRGMALAGYAALMDVDETLFSTPGVHTVETAVRDRPEWANWLIPIWFIRINAAMVCSVSPAYREVADNTIGLLSHVSLLDPDLAPQVTALTIGGEWRQREIFVYPTKATPNATHQQEVVHLTAGHGPQAQSLLKVFDGGVFAILDNGQVASHAGIKNKGLIQEIAVGTRPNWQKRGFGKAVVAAAVGHILTQQKVVTYVPDLLGNTASYALARSLGFAKFAETLLWDFERDE